MKEYIYPKKEDWASLITRPAQKGIEELDLVDTIISAVKRSGDNAVREYTEKFDRIAIDQLQVPLEEIEKSEQKISKELALAIQTAQANIQKFHEAQAEKSAKIETFPGIACWRESVAIERVGLYVPSGSAPLFSTVLMLGTPAKIAGCKEIVLCSPPMNTGAVHTATLYAAKLLGITKVFRIGGVQAMAAMAFGTESVPKVDKVFGPGSSYITAAKLRLAKEGIAFDLPAGPSEVCVIADKTADPTFVAADLLAQAEHGEDSQVVFLTDDKELIDKVKVEVARQLELLPRKQTAIRALKNSRLILLESLELAIEFSNEYAPEHLIIMTEDADELAEKVTNAGSVFLGTWTPEVLGDYASGTNHSLPTAGYARAYSGVSLDSFIKKITFQRATEKGLLALSSAVIEMAKAEGLEAHAEAIRVRCICR